MASIHRGTSSSLSHLNRQVSPPKEGGCDSGVEGRSSKTTRRHSEVDSQHRVAMAFSRGMSASNDN